MSIGTVVGNCLICGVGEDSASTHIVPPFPLQLTFKRPASHAAVLPVETPVSYNRSKVNI